MSSALPEILRLSVNEGGSGRGMSFWSGAAVCGKRELLGENRKAFYAANPQLAPQPDFTKKSAFAVGSAYHKLHELWAKGQLPETALNFNEPIADASIGLAVQLFRAYREHWPLALWGNGIATECVLPTSEWATQTLLELFGEVINAKPDRVVYMDERALDRARCLRSLIGAERPGYYLLDHKTAGADYGEEYYTESLQAYWYPFAWDLDNPEMPVEGMIFDVIRKPDPRRKDQSLSKDNFYAYCAPVRDREYTIQVLRGMIQQGKENLRRARLENSGNRGACFKIEFGALQRCPFYQNGCEGY